METIDSAKSLCSIALSMTAIDFKGLMMLILIMAEPPFIYEKTI